MTTLDFLKMVWPDTGLYLVLMPISGTDKQTGKEWKSYKHFAFPTIEAAAAHATALANQSDPINVYFALASVIEDLTRTKKVDRDLAGKKVRGVHKSGHDNTCAVKAFWLDLDVKPDPKAYATTSEASAALRAFCVAMGLPKPMVTSSGGGFHVYWPLTEALAPDKWQHYANILKQLTESWGLRADPTRTADRASILRPAGTFNWKTGAPRQVDVVVPGSIVDTNIFLGRLAYMAESTGLPTLQAVTRTAMTGTPLVLGGTPLTAAVDTGMNTAAAAGAGYEKSDPRKVVAKCLQLSWQAANQAMVPEPLWYAMIGCMRHAADGAKAIHFLSRMSPTYDPALTDLKIQQHEDGGYPPTTCAKFEAENPGGCNGCPHRGLIKTPLQTVRELVQAPPPVVQLVTTTGTTSTGLPPPPKPFKRVTNPMSGSVRIAMTVESDNGVDVDHVIYDNDVYPSRIVFDERANSYRAVVMSWLPHEGWREFETPMGDLYDKRNTAKTLGNLGVLVDPGNIEAMVQYMVAYLRDLQKAHASTMIYAQLGWRPERDKFILPDRVVSATSTLPVTVSRNVQRALSWEPTKGTLDDWKKIAAVYNRPGMEAHLFGFGVGFASPLFVHTNFNGMIVSLVGERGVGKSSSALLANSIWGHPKMGWGDMEHDTLRAFYNKLGVLNNLPATYDEHTNLEGELVSDLCYMVSKGQGRQRLEQNGQAAENHGNFQLMMLMTGNTSLNARLAMAKADSSAEAARVFEYRVPPNTLTKQEADTCFGPGGAIFDNFGVAAETYVQQLIVSDAWSKDRVQFWVKEVDRLAGVTSGERFWSAGVACVLTGFELSNQCGLTTVDIGRVLNFAVATIKGMRVVVAENTRSPVSMISEYLNSNLRSVLILNTPGSGQVPAQVAHMPTDKLRARLERYSGNLYIDRADFRRFCGRAQIDAMQVMESLAAQGVIKGRDVRYVLGKGTSIKMAQAHCWVIDLTHASMAGMGDLSAVQAPQPTPVAATP